MKQIIRKETAPGILLLAASLLALIMENSFLYAFYDAIKDTPVLIQIGAFKIDKPLLLWINDGLMAVFFLLVGLEIKREVVEGHLSKREQIALPAIAALGGISAPAALYALINWNSPEMLQGWAIPAATDIAFALGILMLMGPRIPVSLKVILVAIAIIDDLAAVVIIAIFYTSKLSMFSLMLGLFGLFIAWLCNKRGVMDLSVYTVLGIFIWACVLKSGVHATLAGVALGMLIPMRRKNKEGKSPLIVMEHTLHPWVAFGIIPVFAFANAGVSLSGVTIETFLNPITLGIMVGLFVGKQLGVMGFTVLASACGLCRLPSDITWMQFYGMALLTGIGFTMSLFIGTLAFDTMANASAVRLGVLAGSVLSALAGIAVLLMSTKKNQATRSRT